jgi:mono/diheme cytochrome c family protein
MHKLLFRSGGEKMRKLLFAALFVLAAPIVSAQEQAPVGKSEAGYQAYMKYQCYTCHGTVGQGGDKGTGPTLTPNPLPYEAFESELRTPRQAMPAYRKQFLSDQELTDIYAYIVSIKPSPEAKDIPLLNF